MARAKTTRKSLSMTQRCVRWLFSPLRLCCAAVLALIWLLWPQVEQQLPQLETREEYRVTASQIQITPPPRWVPEDIVEKVFKRAGFDDSLSLLDPELSEKIALAFYTHPWIERLKHVRKSYPARVQVEVVYREPVATVEVIGGGYYPIDRFGHLLPNEDFSPSDIDRYPIIKNVSTPPAGNLGQSWGDPIVIGAAELAAVLTRPNEAGQSWWNALGLKSILAPSRTSASEGLENIQYRIGTAGGSQVVWGRHPLTSHPGELTVAQKLDRMAEYHFKYDGFDSGPSPFLIDIRDWRVTERSLLAEEPKTSVRQ